jgi:hypothetical protein
MSTRTCKVGVHGRNEPHEFREQDFEVIREARIEVVKMLSHTRADDFERLKRDNPGIEIITRLHDDRIGAGHHPSPAEFADKMTPLMGRLQPYCVKFQVHNEPNHNACYEGWGPSDEQAQDFNLWFLEVYDRLKGAHPRASLGFPGLAVGDADHREGAWLRICRPAIERADWLGVHCYWQTQPDGSGGLLDPAWGLRFQLHHSLYPNKQLEILECGNSNGDRPADAPWPISDEAVADEYVRWLHEAFKHPYVNSASFFILSSDRGNWGSFSWLTEHDWKKPVVWRVGDMYRPPLSPVQVGPPKPVAPPQPAPPRPQPAPHIAPLLLGLTNQHVINALNRASLQLGLGNWGLIGRSGLSLGKLVADRTGKYTGPRLDEMSRLTDQERALIRAQLPADVSFGFPVYDAFLALWPNLALAALDLMRDLHIPLRDASGAVERRVARVWNRYGYLLIILSDVLKLDLPAAVAVLAAAAERPATHRGGRLTIRFEVDALARAWGDAGRATFAEHFRFDAAYPWQGHQYRTVGGDWRPVHDGQEDEWTAFRLARRVAGEAAYPAVGMGLAGMMGLNHALLGYDSAGQMFDAFASSERYQVMGLFDFIGGRDADAPPLRALRHNDVQAFAALFWGPAAAARYAAWLDRAVAAFERLRPV